MTNESATAGSQRRISYVRRDRGSNIDASFANLNIGNGERRESAATLSSLRRRYQRRDTLNSELDEENGRQSESYSQRDEAKVQESNENALLTKAEGYENAKEPRDARLSRHSVLTAKPAVEDAMSKMIKEREIHHDFQLPIIHQSSFIRKPDERIRDKFKNLVRSPADGIPEVHILGELSEGVGFKDTFVSCKWINPRGNGIFLLRRYLEWGKAWSLLAGDESSQTQYSAASTDGVHIWNHPIDVHFATASIQGWPRIIIQICELDEYGRSILSGYGFTHLPTNPGYHELEVHCWRPSGSLIEELNSFFLGTSACLADERIIFGKAWETRSQLNTVSSGIVSAMPRECFLHVHSEIHF
ncbi:hypothetical protein ACHAXA_003190 [Cyclostephanos tholiformis]|uniref:B9 domain-containing protein 2 n=1 Tax=Cyclostephanos tholiformis TaxID=382380 RepID=A0ABD3SSX7_9STRA